MANKKGEEMVSEWEKLEALSKDELIIELVHWRNLYGILRVEQSHDCPWPYAVPLSVETDDGWLHAGQVTTYRWAKSIAQYAASHVVGDEFDPIDLMDYGLDEIQAIEVCNDLYEKNELGLPPGIKYNELTDCHRIQKPQPK